MIRLNSPIIAFPTIPIMPVITLKPLNAPITAIITGARRPKSCPQAFQESTCILVVGLRIPRNFKSSCPLSTTGEKKSLIPSKISMMNSQPSLRPSTRPFQNILTLKKTLPIVTAKSQIPAALNLLMSSSSTSAIPSTLALRAILKPSATAVTISRMPHRFFLHA